MHETRLLLLVLCDEGTGTTLANIEGRWDEQKPELPLIWQLVAAVTSTEEADKATLHDQVRDDSSLYPLILSRGSRREAFRTKAVKRQEGLREKGLAADTTRARCASRG